MNRVTRRLPALAALLALIAPGLSAAAPEAAAAPTAITHPGVLDSRAQLDFVRAKVQAGAQPWN